jgi:hypothetical protein
VDSGLFGLELFHILLNRERKRAERSGRHFVLMLVQLAASDPDREQKTLGKLIRVLSCSTRKTDVKGWYGSCSIGVIFTELGHSEAASAATGLMEKMSQVVQTSLSVSEVNDVRLSYEMYPQPAAAAAGRTNGVRVATA